jgi:hypothetical protein
VRARDHVRAAAAGTPVCVQVRDNAAVGGVAVAMCDTRSSLLLSHCVKLPRAPPCLHTRLACCLLWVCAAAGTTDSVAVAATAAVARDTARARVTRAHGWARPCAGGVPAMLQRFTAGAGSVPGLGCGWQACCAVQAHVTTAPLARIPAIRRPPCWLGVGQQR